MSNAGLTTVDSNHYVFAPLLGTSFGAPTAAGVAAMMLAANPNLTVNQVLSALTTMVEPFPAVSMTRPVCDPSDVNARGHCDCTTSTCGGGILDAGRAVQWAIDRLGDSGVTPYSYAQVYASYFTPERVSVANTPQQGGGGGGGVIDAASLLALMMALLALVAARLKGGKP
jgi:serine protease